MAVEAALTIWSGSDHLLKYTATDEDNTPAAKDLTGAVVTFMVATEQGKVANLILTSPSTGIVITVASTGKYEVTLSAANTEGLTAKHKWYESFIVDSAGKKAVVAFGPLIVKINTTTS